MGNDTLWTKMRTAFFRWLAFRLPPTLVYFVGYRIEQYYLENQFRPDYNWSNASMKAITSILTVYCREVRDDNE